MMLAVRFTNARLGGYPMSGISKTLPVEIERVQLDASTVRTVYQVGHNRTSVQSIFSSAHAYSDLLQHIILRKLSENPNP